jgi:hypothetical protein
VLINYLQDLCGRHLNLEVTGSLLDAIHADLASWYARISSSRVVARARRYIRADDPAAHPERFIRLVCRLIACGALRLAPPGANDRQVIALLGDDKAHIPKLGLNESLAKKYAVAVDVDAISTELHAAGVLLGERAQNYVAGWTVSERWLRQHMDEYQQENRPDFSVVT